jgi:hypothetical protein
MGYFDDVCLMPNNDQDSELINEVIVMIYILQLIISGNRNYYRGICATSQARTCTLKVSYHALPVTPSLLTSQRQHMQENTM